jgi:hypothetical protein
MSPGLLNPLVDERIGLLPSTEVIRRDVGRCWPNRDAGILRARVSRLAALSPEEREWHQRNKEGIDAWLDSLTAPFVATVEETESDYGVLPSSLFTSPEARVVPADVTARPFDECFTDAGRIHAHALGVWLDG